MPPSRSIRARFAATAVLALCLSGATHGASFSNVVSFGDSLSDSGFFGSRFTTNPGTVWTQNLGISFGAPAVSWAQGGTVYATGGARGVRQDSWPDPVTALVIPPTAAQVTHFLASSRVGDTEALYTVWSGASDILYGVEAARAGLLSSLQLTGIVIETANATVDQLRRLEASGARYIVVANLPDIGRTPAGLVNPAAPASFTSFTNLYNTTLHQGLGGLGFDIVALDISALFGEVIANPGAFGFVNATLPACTTSTSLLCTPSTLREPNAANAWVFADAVHPTSGAHRVVSDYAIAVLEAPQKIGLLPEAPLQAYDQTYRALDHRMRSGRDTPRPTRETALYVIHDHSPWRIDGSLRNPGADLTGNALVVGADRPIGPVLAGLAFAYDRSKAAFASNGGGFRMEERSLSAYAGMRFGGGGFVSAALTLGDLEFENVHRNFALGPAVRTESGRTRGDHLGFTMAGSWMFQSERLAHGPVARLAWQRVRVGAFRETGASSTSMRFDAQEVDSMLGSFGWHADGELMTGGLAVRPYGRLGWETEVERGHREVRAALLSTPGSFAMPVYRSDDSWFFGEVGVIVEFAQRAAAFIGYRRQFERGDGRFEAITAGVRIAI